MCRGQGSRLDGQHPDPATSGVAPYRLYNIGNEQPVELLRYIEVLEQCLGKKAIMELLPLQAGRRARHRGRRLRAASERGLPPGGARSRKAWPTS
jgi:hypothetical protein